MMKSVPGNAEIATFGIGFPLSRFRFVRASSSPRQNLLKIDFPDDSGVVFCHTGAAGDVRRQVEWTVGNGHGLFGQQMAE